MERTEQAKRWHGLIGGDEGLESALEKLVLEMERVRASGQSVPVELDQETQLAALAHTVLFDEHTQEELATLAQKMAARVDCDECPDDEKSAT